MAAEVSWAFVTDSGEGGSIEEPGQYWWEGPSGGYWSFLDTWKRGVVENL